MLTLLASGTSLAAFLANSPPTAGNDTARTEMNSSVSVAVLGNDSDADGDALTINSFTQGAHGSVAKVASSLLYTPANNYTGSDSFGYTIFDSFGNSANAQVTVTVGKVSLSSLSLSPTTVRGALSATGTVKVGFAPTANPAVISLSSSLPGVANPANPTVTIPIGQTQATFTINTQKVGSLQSATLKAMLGTTSKTATLKVRPPGVSSVLLSPSTVVGGVTRTSTATVTLEDTAGVGGIDVNLTSSNTNAAFPASATLHINEGDLTGTAIIKTKPVLASTTAIIHATASGTDKAKTLTVKPITLTSLTLSSTSVIGNPSVPITGTVKFSHPAEPYSVAMAVSSSDTNAAYMTIPFVVIPAGQSQGTFQLNTGLVFNDTPVTISVTYGGITKNVTLTVKPGNSIKLRTMSLAVNDMVYNPASKLIYASTPSGLVTIDPLTKVVSSPLTFSSVPGRLALGDDGETLWVSLGSEGAVQKVDLTTGIAGLKFSLADAVQRYLDDMTSVPGMPDSLVIQLMNLGVSPRSYACAAYDNGIRRTKIIGEGNVITPTDSPTYFYGYGNETTEFPLFGIHLSPQGIEQWANTSNLIQGFGLNIRYDSGRVFASNGQVVNPVLKKTLGYFSGLLGNQAFTTVARQNRAFYLTWNSPTLFFNFYDTNNLQLLGQMKVGQVTGNASRPIVWGGKNLAFSTTGGTVYFIDNAPGLTVEAPSVQKLVLENPSIIGGGSMTGTVWLTTPAGPGGVSVNLSVTGSSNIQTPATVFIPEHAWVSNFTITTSAVSESATATISASWNGTSKSSPLTVSTQPLPPGTGVIRVTTPVNDIAYDATRNTIWAVIQPSGGAYANRAIAINATTGAVGTTYAFPAEPFRVAVSEDGHYLYATLDALGTVSRVDLTNGVITNIPIGSPEVFDNVRVMPGVPTTFAVSGHTSGVTLWDGTTRRGVTAGAGNIIRFDDTGTRLYGYNDQTAPWNYYRNAITPSGITLESQTTGLLSNQGGVINQVNGRITTSDGKVFDPETGSIYGQYVGDSLYDFNVFPDPNPASDRTYAVTWSHGVGKRILVFSKTSFAQTGWFDTAMAEGGAVHPIVCGNRRVAFHTFGIGIDRQVVIVPNLP